MITKDNFSRIIETIFDHQINDQELRAHFGVSLKTMHACWIHFEFKEKTKPEHLLWALKFLKSYNTERVLARFFRLGSRETYRKWIWSVIADLSRNKNKVVRSLLFVMYFIGCF